MHVRIMPDATRLADAVADLVAEAQRTNPRLVLALPAGRTPLPLYAELARRHAAGAIDLSQSRAFNLGELVLPKGDPRTAQAFMRQHAWQRIGLRREHCDIPNGAAADPAAECVRYEAAIATAGGLDLVILGVGSDGCIGYNMPGPVTLATHVAPLPDGLAESIGVSRDAWPLRAITMGVGTICIARRIVVLASGPAKAAAAYALINGPADSEWPCSFLHRHPALDVFLDETAATRIAA
jgi:glucosamine-6-phosphate deaminase